MDHLIATFVADRIRRLEEEAATERLARFVASERTRAAWRRYVGNGARRLSVAFEDVALQLDPGACRPSYGRE
jgi:CRP-like cAMP-binding protein